MQRSYEVMFIVRPDQTEEDVDRLISNLEGHVTGAGGAVTHVERMGKRRLAYLVRKFIDGIYVLLTVEGPGPVIHELERRLRVTEQVLKFLTVRIDEEQKRLAKIKAIRASRPKRSAEAAAAPPASEGGEQAPATA
ncbi:MAG TPA: 30S ribosomal protein S6 [Terriglobales bacterium]|nr:30S ribosomal protein S6 [Terriglobales bacterium]